MGETPWRFKSSQPHHRLVGMGLAMGSKGGLPWNRVTLRFAAVAELVDAQVSGTCDREVVVVRVHSAAPFPPRIGAGQVRTGKAKDGEKRRSSGRRFAVPGPDSPDPEPAPRQRP